MSKKQTPESFWERVIKGPDCWEWQGSCNSTGYGTVSWHGRVYCAHRVAAYLVGLVDSPAKPLMASDLTHVLHKCDNRKCCNPDHFFLGSFSDNLHDAYGKGRKKQPSGATHVNAKLTSEEAEEIRQIYGTGARQADLAAMYGVSQRVISLVVRGETYVCH